MAVKHSRTRRYEVVEGFSIGGVDGTIVWRIKISENEDPSAWCYIGANEPTSDAVISSGTRTEVSLDDIPVHVLKEAADTAESDVDKIREHMP